MPLSDLSREGCRGRRGHDRCAYDVRHVTYTRDVTQSRAGSLSIPHPRPPTHVALATAHQTERATQARRGSFFLQRRTTARICNSVRIPSSLEPSGLLNKEKKGGENDIGRTLEKLLIKRVVYRFPINDSIASA